MVRKRVRPPPLPRTPISTPTEGGASDTGTWRIYRPIIDKEKCTKCILCWLYCPEGSITLGSDYTPEINLKHCKGCGICAKECPLKIIAMKFEGEKKRRKK
ncbi:MAG: 4Fe-4S binding protein [Candidatus Bathyarchaeota archaeon]|nr:MAG: 4Fe-4S binding protein [Candidatus Bathyarchaeota archaeon]